MLQKATGRFLYVAHLTELLRDGRLEFAGIADLPAGAGLYAHYLRQLERTLAAPGEAAEASSKPWEFARRVILILAAAEQAHVACQQMLPASIREDVFRGVPLAILAALLDEPGRTVRLTFTLYSLKEILAVWKGEDARDARYALGLKDFVATVEALWPEALTDSHRLLATQMLAALDGRWESVGDEDPLDRWRLQYVVAQVELAGEDNLWHRLIEEEAIELTFARLGELAYDRARYATATGYRSLELAIAQRRVQQQDNPQAGNNLAGVYMNRGNARGDGQDLSGALADYGQAIELLEALRRQLGAEWPPAWANDLAQVYMNRGISLEDTGRLEEAIADWDGAAQIYLNLVNRGQLRAGSQLLTAVLWQFGGFRDLNDWSETARCLVQFLAIHHGLQTEWTAQVGDEEPPWQSTIAQFARWVHGLNPEQRAALLDALGENAEGVKEVFGWT